MGLLGHDKTNDKMEEQIKILATNLEVLNQMLVKDPNLAAATGGTGGGGISPQQYQEFLDNFKRVSNKIDMNDNQLRELLNQELEYIKTTLRKMSQIGIEFPKQKQEFDIVVKRLNTIIEAFSAADKQSISSLAKEMHDFNKNMGDFQETMNFFQSKLVENLNFKINEVGAVVENRIARTGMIGVAVFVIVGLIFLFIK